MTDLANIAIPVLDKNQNTSNSNRDAKSRVMRICIVGSGTYFLSGISYYTTLLATELSKSHQVSIITMRKLIPKLFYPGRKRVGGKITELEYPKKLKVFDGIDWYWLPSMWNALKFLKQQKPEIVIFQWWTGAV